MPTYDELVRIVRNLASAVHKTLGQAEFQLTRESGELMVALKEAHDALLPLHQPTSSASSSAPAAPPEDTEHVIHLGGPVTTNAF